jgi:hypothetical protein
MSFAEWMKQKKKEEEELVANTKAVNGNKITFSEWIKKEKASNVDPNYINTFIKDAEDFLGTSENDFKNLGWQNAWDLYSSKQSAFNDLETRYSYIGEWLNQNKNKISAKSYQEISDVIYSCMESSYSVVNSFKSAKDFYSQFETEDAYNKWNLAEEEYNKNFENVDADKASQGWQKYLADEESMKNAPKYDLNNDGKDAWWEKALGYLGGNGGGVVDTTLPTAGVTQTIHDLRADESHRRPNDDWTEEQKNAFGQLYEVSPTLAYDFAEETNKRNNRTKEEKALKSIAESATSGFWAGAGHTLGAIATAPLGLADLLYDLALVTSGRDVAPDG